jgi:predicted ATPase
MEDAPVAEVLETSPNNLPLQVNRFIGREREMTQVKALLATTRLLTLTGSGGSGKTRLALQVATDLLEEFAQGVCWVELAALSDPLLVPQAVASALGIPERVDCTLTEALSDALRRQHLLLVLDNCEHLLGACRQLIETLLHTCSTLRILTTSREALTITGETVWLVPSLCVPDTYHLPPIEGLLTYEAVQLFIERARSVQPSFTLTQENALAVVQVCRRLDGIPLATELAAARIRVLSVEQIAARLDDAYRLLTGGSRSALARQQTLRAAMDWSYHLLSAQEQALFRRLSVFAGSFSLEAAEAICAGEPGEAGDVLEVLSSLIDKSLVLMEQRSAEARYRLLETMRQYGQEKLQQAGEVAAVRRCHGDWYVRFVERAGPEAVGLQQIEWLQRVELEHDNIRTALAWSLEQAEAEPGARIGAAIWRFWLYRGYLTEGRTVLERILQHLSEQTAVRAQVLHAAGVLAFYQVDYARANILLEESLELSRALPDREGIAYALTALGNLSSSRGDYLQATTFYAESLPLLRELGDKRVMVLALSGWGLALLALGEYERAIALCEESLALARELGSPQSVAGSLTTLAIAVLERGDYERARGLCEESLAIRQQLADKGGSAHTLTILGHVALSQGSYAQAKAHYDVSLSLRQELGDKEGIAAALEGLAGVAQGQGQPLSAARLYGAAQVLRDAIGAPLAPTDRASYERRLADVRVQLEAASFEKAATEGRAFTLEHAIAEAEQVHVQAQITPTAQSPTGGAPPTLPQAPASSGNPFGLTVREIEMVQAQQAQVRERERIEQELRKAQLIQRSLLPEALPRLSGWRLATYYQAAREVGGDFYDFIPFEDGRLGLLIGDATGKGIPAALVMTTTCTMLRAAAQATASPGEVLARVNDLLYARIPPGMFVTCFYAILDHRSGRLRYATAGQDLPYRCHSNGVSELQAAGMPLGLMPDSSYEEHEVTLSPGESLLFYSDGLVEAHSPSREMFGYPRLQSLLAEQADGASLIDFLLGELKRFTSDGWEQEDDVTLLLLQRMAEPAPA